MPRRWRGWTTSRSTWWCSTCGWHAVDAGDRAQGLTRGADAYLAEPIEPEELVATAHAVLRYHRARRRAELLAERLAALADATVQMHAAPNFVRLLEAAAAGAARIFRSPAAVVAETFDGNCVDGVVAAPDAPPTTVPWHVHDTGLLYVVVPTATQTVRTPVLVQLAQAVASAVEAQRSFDEGLAALSGVATRVDDDLDQFCRRLLVEPAPPEIQDDVAVLAVRRR